MRSGMPDIWLNIWIFSQLLDIWPDTRYFARTGYPGIYWISGWIPDNQLNSVYLARYQISLDYYIINLGKDWIVDLPDIWLFQISKAWYLFFSGQMIIKAVKRPQVRPMTLIILAKDAPLYLGKSQKKWSKYLQYFLSYKISPRGWHIVPSPRHGKG